MADVVNEEERYRGQLIIITGLLVAVSLVAITLLLNTAIYTENLASRGTDLGSQDALVYQQISEETFGELIDKETYREHSGSGLLRDNVTTSVALYNETMTERYAQRGQSVDILSLMLHDGTLIQQTDPNRNMTNKSWEPDWVLANNIEETRQFTVNISDGLKESEPPGNDTFEIIIDGSATWKLFAYLESGNPTLAVKNESDDIKVLSCGFKYDAEIDLTAGTVDGDDCSGLVFGKDVTDQYDVTFQGGNNSRGSYSLIVNGSVANTNDFDSTEGNPNYHPAIYSLRFEAHYQNPELNYSSTVRVARGES